MSHRGDISHLTGRVFVPIRYPGYYFHVREHHLYSIKRRKNKPPRKLSLQDSNAYMLGSGRYARGEMRRLGEGWQISHEGQALYVSKDELMQLDFSNPICLIVPDNHFDDDLFTLE